MGDINVLGENRQTDFFAVTTNGQTGFTLSQTPLDTSDVKMHINGSAQRFGADFTVVGTSLTWTDADFTLEIGDTVEVEYNF